MPSIDKKKVGFVYVDQYSKYENLATVSDSSVFLIKDNGIYVGQNTVANYVDTDSLLSVADASLTYQLKGDYVLSSSLAEVAFNGSYNYLEDRPVIPTKLSDLINDAGYAYDASVMNLNKVPYVTDTAAANVTIEPYKMYDFGTVSTAMIIAFDTTKEITGYTKEYIIRFTAETGCAVSLPNGVLYTNGTIPTYIAGHIYEINIVNGCAVVAEFY